MAIEDEIAKIIGRTKNFVKDVTPHRVGLDVSEIETRPFPTAEELSFMQQDPIEMGELNEVLDTLPDAVVLPESVKRFNDTMVNGFDNTVAHLRHVASKLRNRAEMLEHKADMIDRAKDEVRGTIESWVQYEREAKANAKFYEPLIDV